jgi:hypothetical protein
LGHQGNPSLLKMTEVAPAVHLQHAALMGSVL